MAIRYFVWVKPTGVVLFVTRKWLFPSACLSRIECFYRSGQSMSKQVSFDTGPPIVDRAAMPDSPMAQPVCALVGPWSRPA